jgi:hypothetical protein
MSGAAYVFRDPLSSVARCLISHDEQLLSAISIGWAFTEDTQFTT